MLLVGPKKYVMWDGPKENANSNDLGYTEYR
jgi:hypothetical protein